MPRGVFLEILLLRASMILLFLIETGKEELRGANDDKIITTDQATMGPNSNHLPSSPLTLARARSPPPHSVKVQTSVLKDPIKRSVQRTLEEKGLSKDVIRPRETLSVLEWATGKIEATPHGFFAKMMSESRKPANATKSKTMESRVAHCLDQYNVARGRAELDREFPQGKKTKHTQKKERLVLS